MAAELEGVDWAGTLARGSGLISENLLGVAAEDEGAIIGGGAGIPPLDLLIEDEDGVEEGMGGGGGGTLVDLEMTEGEEAIFFSSWLLRVVWSRAGESAAKVSGD